MNKTIFAHRGLPRIAPENTLSGFQQMPAHNIQWFETDIAITNDGELVIIHDDFLERTTNQAGEVSALNYADLQHADAGSWFGETYQNEKLPTMADIVAFVNETKTNVNLELKGITGPNGLALSNQLVEKMADFLAQIDPDVEIIISSFNPILLAKMHERSPEYNYAILFEHHTFYPDWQLIADACGATIVHLENTNLTEAIVKDIKQKGYLVNVWTVNEKDRANELFHWGVDGIFTDIADQFMDVRGVAQ